MKDLQNNKEQSFLKVFNASNTTLSISDGYIIAFQHPVSGNLIFLASCADISSICYSKYPMLPGTGNIKKSKVYSTLEEARNDIYLLRYHHRQFLNVIIFAKHVLHFHAEKIIDVNDPQIAYYPVAELMLEDN